MEKLIETTLMAKLRKMPLGQQQEVLNFVEFLETKSNKIKTTASKLEKAAESLLAEYENDEELTAFTILDSEDFHE